MIIAKSATLDRENSNEVEKFNSLLEDYYNLLFIVGDANLDEEDKENVDSLMDKFRNTFRDKNIKVKKSDSSFKGQEFSSDVTRLGDLLKHKPKK